MGVPGLLNRTDRRHTHTHAEAHPLDLSGPPARTQPTSPPHLAYLRWDMWAAWGPCNFSSLGLAVCVPVWRWGVGRVVCLRSVYSSRFSIRRDSLVAGEQGIEARHTSWCER